MSSYTNHLKEDEAIYRGFLQYEYTPMEWTTDPTGRPVRMPTGPDETVIDIIGPYQSVAPIKSYVTRNRNGWKKNLRILRVEKVAEWEEVEI